ncbi:MAG: hypothetical protein Q8Q30_03465 [Candidatus Woesebacteria bacterium]|nr:hypothetical protein [Candidatus Woesebacteria bacterium]
MLETPHVALGVAIAVAIPNPLISIPLAFASHFILDKVPHWNPHLNTETKKYGYLTNKTLLIIGLDLACAAVLTIFVSRGNVNILLASFASILPDIVEGPYFLFGWKNEVLQKWISFQKSIQSEANLFWGLLTQVLVILGALYIIT